MLTPLTTPKDLAHMLGTTPRKLNYTLYAKGVNTQYTSFSINKKNGSYRTIHAPQAQLKRLQQRLVVHLEHLYEPHCAAMGFVKKRGILENAKQHIKKRVVFNIDLENFFNQINFGRVRGLLTAKPYSLQEDTATIIAHMCCYRQATPQGAPTSPIISNMICKKLDRELSFLAKQNKAFYTRYADDITFSFHSESENEIYQNSDSADPSETASVSEKLDKIILLNGFSIRGGFG